MLKGCFRTCIPVVSLMTFYCSLPLLTGLRSADPLILESSQHTVALALSFTFNYETFFPLRCSYTSLCEVFLIPLKIIYCIQTHTPALSNSLALFVSITLITIWYSIYFTYLIDVVSFYEYRSTMKAVSFGQCFCCSWDIFLLLYLFCLS